LILLHLQLPLLHFLQHLLRCFDSCGIGRRGRLLIGVGCGLG
jgi:hypothetical protein